jgi:hypothetical protein
MKGDFTRFTFDPAKNYSSVRLQQGRVLLDAEWNEQVDIQQHGEHTTAADVIGPCGAPASPPGTAANFQITAAGSAFDIAPGRIYVDGILVENSAPPPASANGQPYLPANPPLIRNDAADPGVKLPAIAGRYLAYLDVWQRHVTVLEDPALREIALGVPDTSTRTQTVWQVFLQPAAGAMCASLGAAWPPAKAATTGLLSARARPAADPANQCEIPAGGGYSRLENQLYRVEVETSGDLGAATFKWSRDNGMVAARVIDGDASTLTVDNPGRDSVLAFAAGQWVELINDEREWLNQPGKLLEVTAVKGDVLSFAANSVTLADFPGDRRVRRWENQGKIEQAADNDGYLKLESGVEVLFSAGYYRRGDYWLIPARTLDGDVQWPKTLVAGEYQPVPQPPAGVQHHFCPLAILDADAVGLFTVVSDCRPIFPPLTRLTRFFYLSGDGQEALPGDALPQPLEVGVANGGIPVAGAIVRFTILNPANATILLGEAGQSGVQIDVLADANGIACCTWTLDADPAHRSQVVTAVLLDDSSNPAGLPAIQFNATANIGLYYVGGDGQPVMPGGSAAELLQVRVATGDSLAVGRTVRFTDDNPNARLAQDRASLPGVANAFDAVVDASGIAACAWLPDWSDPNAVTQRVRARLLDPAGNEALSPVFFTAHLSAARLVAYTPGCNDLNGATNVQDAIDRLCARPGGGGSGSCITVGEGGQIGSIVEALAFIINDPRLEFCLCLLPGDHVLTDTMQVSRPDTRVSVTISGCGPGTRLLLDGGSVTFDNIASITLRDMEIQAGNFDGQAPLVFAGCGSISIVDCTLYGFRAGNSLLRIRPGARRIFIARNTIHHISEAQFAVLGQLLAGSAAAPVVDVLATARLDKYREKAARAAMILVDPGAQGTRRDMAKALETAVGQSQNRLSGGTALQMLTLAAMLRLPQEQLSTATIVAAIDTLRVAAGHGMFILGQPGPGSIVQTALIVDDAAAHLTLEDNEIVGTVLLYGDLDLDRTRKLFDQATRNRLQEAIKGSLLLGGGGVLQVTNNRLTGLMLGVDILRQLPLDGPLPAQTTLSRIYRHVALTGNVIAGVFGSCLGQSAALTSNLFTLGAFPFINIAIAVIPALTFMTVSAAATLTGNQAPSGNPAAVLPVVAPRRGDVSSNLDVGIVV